MLHFARWKIALIFLACLAGLLFALPNVMTERAREAVSRFLPTATVNLGLDLQGGSQLLLEVDTAAVLRERLEALVNDARSALRKERIPYTGLGISDGAVSVRITRPEHVDRAYEALRKLAQPLRTTVFTIAGGNDLQLTRG